MARLSVSLSGAGGKYAILAPFRASGMYALCLFFPILWRVQVRFLRKVESGAGVFRLSGFTKWQHGLVCRFVPIRRKSGVLRSPPPRWQRRFPTTGACRRVGMRRKKVLIPSRDKFSDFKIATFWWTNIKNVPEVLKKVCEIAAYSRWFMLFAWLFGFSKWLSVVIL